MCDDFFLLGGGRGEIMDAMITSPLPMVPSKNRKALTLFSLELTIPRGSEVA